MGREAATEMLRMLDSVDTDVEEFGVAGQSAQMLVQVSITLRRYYHMFQQGWLWQRVMRARVPAELCVTVALHSSGAAQALLRTAKQVAAGAHARGPRHLRAEDPSGRSGGAAVSTGGDTDGGGDGDEEHAHGGGGALIAI